MKRVLLINQALIPHYRIPVYNYLSEYLGMNQFILTVVSGGLQQANTESVQFDYRQVSLSFVNLIKLIREIDPDVIIFWVNLKHLYLFPTLLFSKILMKKVIYWGI